MALLIASHVLSLRLANKPLRAWKRGKSQCHAELPTEAAAQNHIGTHKSTLHRTRGDTVPLFSCKQMRPSTQAVIASTYRAGPYFRPTAMKSVELGATDCPCQGHLDRLEGTTTHPGGRWTR
jgi:hypothetical protein